MAKPDLQSVFVDPSNGQLKRLKGKLGLAEALENVIVAANESAAKTAGLPVGGIWADSSD
ncbi:hypothetical protein LCGC14_2628800, partial [marine sediment metagenome]